MGAPDYQQKTRQICAISGGVAGIVVKETITPLRLVVRTYPVAEFFFRSSASLSAILISRPRWTGW